MTGLALHESNDKGMAEAGENGAYPSTQPQHPENMAATIYRALGIPDTASWRDELDRPHQIDHDTPIPGLI